LFESRCATGIESPARLQPTISTPARTGANRDRITSRRFAIPIRAGGRAAAFGAALAALACPALASAQVTGAPDPLAFGQVRVGTLPERNVTLSNADATNPAQNVTCSIVPPTADFAVAAADCPATVPAGGTATVTVSFAPDARGLQNATLRIDYEIATVPQPAATVALSGTGVAPDMAVTIIPADPPPLVFEGAVVGTASVTTFTLRVANTGDDVLNASLAEAGANPGDWTYAPPAAAFAVQPGANRDIVATFTPGAAGARAANVTIADVDGLSTPPMRTIGLQGTGLAPALEVAPASLAFGSIDLGSASAAQTVTVSNTGNADLAITAVTLAGASPGDYEATFTVPNVLSPAESMAVQVVFRPTVVGARNAQLVVVSDSPVPPVMASVTLTGTGTGAAGIAISPTALVFGVIDVQVSEPVTRQVTITNPGNLPLVIGSVSLEELSGEPYAGGLFEVVPPIPDMVAGGGTATIDVRYAPLVESAGDFAVLVLETNVATAPVVEVTLSGRGVDRFIQVDPLSIDFRPAYRNPGEPEEVALEVRNTGGSPLVLGEIMTEGDAASSFVVVGDLEEVIAPGESSTIGVQFQPRAAPDEPLVASLVIVTDDDSEPLVRVDLSGLGLLPPISATYSAIRWGSVAVGLDLPPPGGEPFTVRNDSAEETFIIQDVRVMDDQGQEIDAVRVSGFRDPVELRPGEELTLEVAFAPTRGVVVDGAIEVLVGPDPEPVVRVAVSGEAIETDARGGAGCSASGSQPSGGSPGPGGWLLIAAAALGLARTRRGAALLALALAGAVTLAGEVAWAQVQVAEDLDLASFRPVHAIDPIMVTVESTDVGQAGNGALGVAFDYARNPLVLRAADGAMDHPVSSRSTVEFAGAFAFGGRFEVAAVVPFLLQSGDTPQFSGIQPADGAALGDIRARGKVFIGASGRLRLGAAAELTLPTALDTQFAGVEGPSALARLLGDYRRGRLHVAVNAGAIMRERVRLADVEQGHQAVYGAATAYQVIPRLHAVAELFGAAGLSGGPAGTRPLEAVLAARLRISREVGLLAGAGRGLLAGVGAPEVRGFFAIGWSPGARPIAGPDEDPRALTDDDRDGVVKRDDRCPDEMEDQDGYQDLDGCLDRDDDGDRVNDVADRCPREAEDLDDYEDEDGCPDPDNDGDGVADAKDGCPARAEDVDQFEDEDGCPDPDNDGDGVADASDRCPLEKETINGNRDDDGCADPGSGLVVVTADKIEILEPIRFRGEGSELTRSSQRLLGQMAATLRAHAEITRVRIRAHVHPRGAGDEELSVTRAETVRRWLVEWGIEPSRLEGVGFGSRQQLLSGNGSRARQMNDRVDFEIVERRPAR
jgi:outer membrane protein OmpA-like peptidoglycan-associated protein